MATPSNITHPTQMLFLRSFIILLQAARLILSQVSQAYGLMILGEGLFQADGHPGNILVQRGGRVALLDYGQSKQLEEKEKLAFADLVLAMNRYVVLKFHGRGPRVASASSVLSALLVSLRLVFGGLIKFRMPVS